MPDLQLHFNWAAVEVRTYMIKLQPIAVWWVSLLIHVQIVTSFFFLSRCWTYMNKLQSTDLSASNYLYTESTTWLVIGLLVDNNFLTWLLIGWRLSRQPIRGQVWNFLLINVDFSMEISLKSRSQVCLPVSLTGASCFLDLWRVMFDFMQRTTSFNPPLDHVDRIYILLSKQGICVGAPDTARF